MEVKRDEGANTGDYDHVPGRMIGSETSDTVRILGMDISKTQKENQRLE